MLGLLIVTAISAANQRIWLIAGLAWIMAFQLKQFAVLLAPFLLVGMLAGDWRERLQAIERFAIGLVVGLGPFAVFYWRAADLWLRPLQVQSMGLVFNPFHWRFWEPWRFGWLPTWLIGWNSLATYLTLSVVFGIIANRHWITALLEGLPLMFFGLIVKSLDWAQFWYMILVPPFILCLANYRRVAIALLAIHWLQCGRSIELLRGHEFGWREEQVTTDHFRQCMWTCDYRVAQ